MVMPELRVVDSQVRSVATGLGSAVSGLVAVEAARTGAPITGSARVGDAIANAAACHAARAGLAAEAAQAVAAAARTSLDQFDAAERALLAALA
ncbi:hypothetical protein [Agromyces laixinhei]|uniref:hypothetical protein n=1 Tax=Agromyces laixinhei TaxID=2585717 RepID=UPI0012EDEDD4|nr:hypothetical protein [Agromyces laixinhei]